MAYPTNASPIGCYMLRDSSVLHNNGLRNICTGIGAGYSLVSGIENTFNGFNAGNLVTTGGQNTFVGSHADDKSEVKSCFLFTKEAFFKSRERLLS